MVRVLVVGVPRSGTTWVGRALGSMPGVAYVNEPDDEVGGGFEPGEERRVLGSALRAKRNLSRFPALSPEEAAPEYERLWNAAFTIPERRSPPTDLARRARRRAWRAVVNGRTGRHQIDEWLVARRWPRSALLRAGLACLAVPRTPSSGSRHVVAKSICCQFSMEWIQTRWHPRVLVVRRHPLNVLASWRDLGWLDERASRLHGYTLHESSTVRNLVGPSMGVPPLPPGATPLAQAVWHIGLLSTVLEDGVRRNPAWVVTTHEHLCTDPSTRLSEVSSALSLPWGEAGHRYLERSNRPGSGGELRRVASQQADSWRRRLTPDQVEEANDMLGRFPIDAWNLD